MTIRDLVAFLSGSSQRYPGDEEDRRVIQALKEASDGAKRQAHKKKRKSHRQA